MCRPSQHCWNGPAATRIKHPRLCRSTLTDSLGRVTSARHPYVGVQGPTAFAHRGGARESTENSITAFKKAAAIGYTYFETDVRATSDGQVMVFHDGTLNRVTDRVGRISALPYAEVKKARMGGKDRILKLEDLLEAMPDAKFNIDIKDDHTLAPFCDLVERLDVLDRICVASFSAGRLRTVRHRFGAAVATSLGPPEVAGLIAASRLGPLRRLASLTFPSDAVAVQVPERQNFVPIVTDAFISEAHDRGIAVHVWTVDDEGDMHRLLDMGVDGVITDRPTLLRDVLESRGQWPAPA